MRQVCLAGSIRWGMVSRLWGRTRQGLTRPGLDTLDSWFHDLQQYESTLDALATASLDQAFTDELNAIEQCESGPS